MKSPKPQAKSSLFVEPLEPRIAPAGLLNEAKFTTVPVGGTVLLDASDPNGFQGITTGTGGGSGAYLLYVSAGKALVYTSDLNGDHILESNEITGISAAVDSNGHPLDLTLFTSVHGDIITNLLPGRGVSAITDSDNNPNNGLDGRVLLDSAIHSITLRTVTAADLDPSIANDTPFNRAALTTFSIYGNIYTGGDFGGTGGGLTIDTSGAGLLAQKFNGFNSTQLYNGSDHPYVSGIYTGAAASSQHFTLTYGVANNVQGEIVPFTPAAGEHGGDINGVQGASTATIFDISVLDTGHGGTGARGGNISNAVLHGDRGGYQIITGDGGSGATGGNGGAIINFNDLGTVTSQVIVHTGDGGAGSLGAGGAGGVATFGNAALAANLQIYLGKGGGGFSSGGTGDGLTNATFAIPEGQTPTGGNVLGTFHDVGDIGNQVYLGNGKYAPHVIDFNGDGNGDVIFTTANPDQVVVLFGEGNGLFNDTTGSVLSGRGETVYLETPGLAVTSITVADVNGDGRPDVIVSSDTPDNAGGIFVFLNQIGDNVHNPVGGAQFSRNPLGDHPFSSAFITPLPSFTNFGFYDSTNPVTALSAGDYNHDGIIDIAYVAQYKEFVSQKIDVAVGVMYGHAALNVVNGQPIMNTLPNGQTRPAGTGYFYANSNPNTTALPILQDVFDGNTGAGAVLRSSAQNATLPGATPLGPDLLFYAAQGAKGGSVFQASGPFTGGLDPIAGFAPGSVDTDRALGPMHIALSEASIQDFAISDLNSDGIADVTILTKAPGDFLVTNFATPGVYNFAIGSGLRDNAGLLVDDSGKVGTTILNIQPIDYNGTGVFNGAALLDFGSSGPHTHIREVILPPAFVTFGPGTVPTIAADLQLFAPTKDMAVHGFDAFYLTTQGATGAAPVTGFAAVAPNLTDYRFAEIEFASGATPAGVFFNNFRYLTDNGIRIFAGAGGDSTAGAGGAGGNLGATLTVGANAVATGSLDVIFPAYAAYSGEAAFVGGTGGSGFAGGGNGGNIQGLSTSYSAAVTILNSAVNFQGGNGGNGVIGDGGNGGSLTQFSLASGESLIAGNAGAGVHGGAGGNVVGNGTGGAVPDLQANSFVTVIAGFGGQGSLQGGVGGAINGFQPTLISGGPLAYISGDGGSAAAGTGGAGGQIINSSPNSSQNDLSGSITLATGNGGNGLTGGAGGAVTTFVNLTTSSTGIPLTLDVLTGAGGVGISSDGGVGGAITGVAANASGLGTGPTFPTALVRVLAGNGGASFGGQGGVGGMIANSSVQATSSAIVIAAGAGGSGLTIGGTGGSVMNDLFNSSALNIGKVLVIAGAGGDASAALNTDVSVANDGNTGDLAHAILAFGGASGIGGDGGNITRLTQPVSTQTAVDLIAGNGGSTLNYGSSLDAHTNVGHGGSIDTINVAGTIGAVTRDVNLQFNPPIKSYLDTTGSGTETGTLSNFVVTKFGGTVDTTQLPGPRFFNPNIDPNTNSLFVLDNAAGNVGIVAGLAGRVQGGQPAPDAVNGSAQNITASSIMSIVAGSVDRVAPVQVLSNITATNIGGMLGADKSPNPMNGPLFGGPDGLVQYFDQNGNLVNNLQPGYRLFDGALFAISIQQPASGGLLRGPRIFSPAG